MSFIEENDQTHHRREHLKDIAALVGDVYPNKFERSRRLRPPHEDTITAVVENVTRIVTNEEAAGLVSKIISDRPAGIRPAPEELERANKTLNDFRVRLAGRISVPPRVMGKAAFVHLSDGKSRLQIYVRKDETKAIKSDGGDGDGWELFRLLDHGDFIGVSGYLFLTKTGELSVHTEEITFLAKALAPMPDKLHGVHDAELRQRRRYVDLIAGSLKVETDIEPEREGLTTREVFERRSKIISEMRRFLDERDFIEVETPMLTSIASGAAARPFKTHHNALDIDLYARIAPELYLKRLLVGGFERVYEINRNFRNEGISTRHNPEFTMLEFYAAYWDVNRMIDFCEEMVRAVARIADDAMRVRFENQTIDFNEAFARMTMKQAIAKYWPEEWAVLGGERVSSNPLNDPRFVRQLYLFVNEVNVGLMPYENAEGKLIATRSIEDVWQGVKEEEQEIDDPEEVETARHIERLFEEKIEHQLIQPTFITNHPKAISPLSKASPNDSTIAERFELFIAGMECANGFSELNDPQEQHARFEEQMKARERGDEEAMPMDEDYLRALSFGMPPAAGIGIGVDRLVMLLTNRQSIRDVILFPHLRPERGSDEV